MEHDILYSDINIAKVDTVLFVDDELNILQSIKRGLMDEPFQQFYAQSAQEALRIMKENEIAVLVTDMRMPEMSGLDLIRIVSDEYPDTVKMILTGYAQVSNLLAAINSGQIFRYIVKPWKMESEFLPAIKQAIQYYNLKKQKEELYKKSINQYEIIKKRVKEVEELNALLQKQLEKRNSALKILTEQAIPFTSETIQALDEIDMLDKESIKLISKDLKNKGLEILKMLRKIESILNA